MIIVIYTWSVISNEFFKFSFEFFFGDKCQWLRVQGIFFCFFKFKIFNYVLSPVIPLLYIAMSSNLGFFTACPAIGHPDSDLCVENEPLM